MGDKTGIEWTRGQDGRKGATWTCVRARNTKTGKVGWHCEHKTIACIHCYAESMNEWVGTGLPFKPGHLDNGDVELFLDEVMLQQPLRWKSPRRIFCDSMTDIAARFMTREWMDRKFAVMSLAYWHTFIILTKRIDVLQAYLADPETPDRIRAEMWVISARRTDHLRRWPLPNIEIGASIHDQPSADEVVPKLLASPAAVRILSIEPQLGPIRLDRLPDGNPAPLGNGYFYSALTGRYVSGWPADCDPPQPFPAKIDQVIIGGESGRGARFFNITPARDLLRQCSEAGTAAFLKQLGRRPYWDLVGGLGTWPPGTRFKRIEIDGNPVDAIALEHDKGGDPLEWAEDLRVQQFPEVRQ